jgi:hypothetical protein
MGNPARIFLEAFAMITINVNFLKAALLFASDEQTRYYLKGVHLLRRGDHLRITATDGHRLFCAMQTLDAPGDNFDIILPRDGLKKALTGVHRNCEVLALDLEWYRDRVNRDRVKRAVLNDLAMPPVDGTFPTIERVVPDANSIDGETASFNPLYLADIGKAAKLLGAGVADFHLGHNGTSPALVTFGGTADALAVIMPLRCQVAPMLSGDVAAILGRDAPAASEKAA